MTERRLLFVAGATPQIITETVYQLAQSDKKAVTTDVVVITTTLGKKRMIEELLVRRGPWSKLKQAYPKTRRFVLDDHRILLIPGPKGEPLEDVRTAADSQAAGDFILEQVKRFTADGQPALHASLAGGRKTMSYLLGVAMIFFGRPEDRLSHVLVQPGELEGSDFFFPLPQDATIKVVGPTGHRVVRCADIRIDLVDLPFPRLRLFQDEPDLSSQQFSELVARLERRLSAVLEPSLEIDWYQRRLRCAGTTVRLSPLQFGIYALLAERRQVHGGRTNCSGCEECFVPAAEVEGEFATRLRELMKRMQSRAVYPGKWKLAHLKSEVSHIARRLAESLGKAGRRYEVCRLRFEGQQLFGIPLSPSAIRVKGSSRSLEP